MRNYIDNSFLCVAVRAESSARPIVHWKWGGNALTESELEKYCRIALDSVNTPRELDTLSLFADRYGGEGIGFCGGSARCATDFHIQIKGVGLTPLFGTRPNSEPDLLHSDGTIDLLDAGHEAIMSSICGAVLPYGAVPTIALASTGTLAKAAFAAPKSSALVPRIILLRRFAWRPAHFLRNILFNPRPELKIPDDSARVRVAMQMLPAILERELGVEQSRINDGLLVMAERFAKQLAAAHAKRIFHGGLSPSNIALDGRFLDFGTCTAVPAYRRRVGAPKPSGADLWTQSAYVERIFSSLLQHIERYLRLPSGYKLLSAPDLIQEFRSHHNTRMAVEFSKLSGVPEEALLLMPRILLDNVHRCMQEIALRGNRRFLMQHWHDDSHTSAATLQSIGRHDLNDALCAYAEERLYGSGALRNRLSDSILADALSDSLDSIYAVYMERYAVESQRSVRAIALHRCLRLNGPLDFLVREAIYKELSKFEENPLEVGEFINTTISNALHVLDS